MDSTIAASLIGVAGILLGIWISEALAVRRENRQRGSDRRHLAGALAAELRGLLLRWQEIAPQDGGQRPLIAWQAEETYFPVYDNAGARLSLLPPDLAPDVVRYYTRAKAAMWSEPL